MSVDHVGHETFGFEAPRFGRREAIESVLAGRGPLGGAGPTDGAASAADAPFAVGTRVQHTEWGEGAVQRDYGDQRTVLVDSVGYKTLSVGLVVDGDLLTAV